MGSNGSAAPSSNPHLAGKAAGSPEWYWMACLKLSSANRAAGGVSGSTSPRARFASKNKKETGNFSGTVPICAELFPDHKTSQTPGCGSRKSRSDMQFKYSSRAFCLSLTLGLLACAAASAQDVQTGVTFVC